MQDKRYDVGWGTDKNGRVRFFICDLKKDRSDKGFRVSGYYKWYFRAYDKMTAMNRECEV